MLDPKTLETLTKLLDVVDDKDVADDKPERQQQLLDSWEQPAMVQPQDTGMGMAL